MPETEKLNDFHTFVSKVSSASFETIVGVGCNGATRRSEARRAYKGSAAREFHSQLTDKLVVESRFQNWIPCPGENRANCIARSRPPNT